MEALSSSSVCLDAAGRDRLSSTYRPVGTCALQPSESVIAIHGLQPSVSFAALVVRIETDSCEGTTSLSRLNLTAPMRAGEPRSTRLVSALLGVGASKSRTAKPGALLRMAKNLPGDPGTGSSAFTWEEELPAK